MKVLVCGGRDFDDSAYLSAVLCQLHSNTPITSLIHGAARGADNMAGEWAGLMEIPVTEYPADWAREGRGAGPLRNQRMLDEGRPELVVAFPGGAGTKDMVGRARKAGVRVVVIKPTPRGPLSK